MSQQPDKFDGTSASITDEQKAKLRALFPEIITESGKVDFDKLKLTLGESVDVGKERYGMNWPGKSDCFKTIQKPSMATLIPARDESVNFDTTENLIIEGDNLEVLKLLQKAYIGKVKMIYIDPPYNTGGDFIYPDNFSESLETYLRYTRQTDEEGRKFSTNTDTDGRFHSKWMNMMYPRLFLARNLLRDDGVIFISIDDHEVDNLRKVCNEIFGEENFVASIVWQKKYSVANDDSGISPMHDYILAFSKSDMFERGLFPRTEQQESRFTNPDNDPRGDWSSGEYISGKTKEQRPTLWYPIRHPKTGEEVWPQAHAVWRYSRDKHEIMEKEGRLYWGLEQNYKIPRLKRYKLEAKDGVVPSTWWPHAEAGHNDAASKELAALMQEPRIFDNPKPVSLLTRLITLADCKGEDLILDYFGGSGTTAHSILQFNKDESASCNFILIQLPEPTNRKDYKTIADITKERVRRVIKRLNEADKNQLGLGRPEKQDRGFKVFKLQSSNFKSWNAEQPKDEAEFANQLTLHVDHLVTGRSQEDVLYELLLKSGFPLDTPIEKLTLSNKTVFSIAEGMMLVCLEHELKMDVLKAMADKKPERVVCLDAGFANNDQLKTNAVQTMKAKGVTKFQTV